MLFKYALISGTTEKALCYALKFIEQMDSFRLLATRANQFNQERNPNPMTAELSDFQGNA